MKACFISHSQGKAGAEKALVELAESLQLLGVKCHVFLPKHGFLSELLYKKGISYEIFPYRWWVGDENSILKHFLKAVVKTLYNIFSAIFLAYRIKQLNCDVVYTNTNAVCAGALAAKILRIPHVWHVHEFGYEDHGLQYDLGEKVSLFLMNFLSHACITNSFAVAQKYQKYINNDKIYVAYQSVTVEELPASKEYYSEFKKENVATCAILGMLKPGKCQDEAILAFSGLIQRKRNVHLYIVGSGDEDYLGFLKNLVSSNHLEKYVTFVEWVDYPVAFIMNCTDIVLVCSKNEAFGRVAIEAMLAEKPVIGSKSGGTVELIRDGENGLLYTPGNYEELADKIEFLSQNVMLARKLGVSGKKWAEEKFTQENYGKTVLPILEKINGV